MIFQLRHIPLIIMLSIGTVSMARAQTAFPNALNSPQAIIDDMTLPHEGIPHGVPESYDWSRNPRMGNGNNMGDFTAFIPWGQVYEAASGNTATNTRVELRDMEAYVLSVASGRWEMIQFDRLVQGEAYREDFADDESIEADTRPEPTGTLSVTAGNGYNFHFCPSSGRVLLDADDVGGIFTTVQARLILDDPNGIDDRGRARYLLSVGADYWENLDIEWQSYGANADVAIGRFRYVMNEWDSFNMTTLPSDVLAPNPPPLR